MLEDFDLNQWVVEAQRTQKFNQGIVSGTLGSPLKLSHMVMGEKFYEGVVVSERLSGEDDLVPVVISERLLGNKIPETGEFMSLSGEFRSHNYMNEGKSHLQLYLFAKDIEVGQEAKQNGEENSIRLYGYVCKDTVYRQTPLGREITDMLIAVNRPMHGKCDYIPVITWGRNALFARDIKVGDSVVLEGRLQSREYRKVVEGQIQEKTAYEISCRKVMLCSKATAKEDFSEDEAGL